MSSKKLKRFLSIALSLSMVFSMNVTSFAADITAADDTNVPHIHMDTANHEGDFLSDGHISANPEETAASPAEETETGAPSDNASDENTGNGASQSDPEDSETPPENPGQTTAPTDSGNTTDPENPGETTDPTEPGGTTEPGNGNPEQPTPPSEETCQHDWQVTSVIKAMDCATNTNGIQFVTCSKCKETDYQTVPAAHTPGTSSIRTEATCTENGIRDITCTVCGNSYEEEIPATGQHDYQQHTTEATCETPKTITWVCSMCDAVDSSRTSTDGEALGHDDDNEFKRILTEATCTTDGSEFVRCSRCGRTAFRTVPSAGSHTWNIELEHIASTCKEQGKNIYKCSVCGEEDTTRTELIPVETEPLKEHGGQVKETCKREGCTHSITKELNLTGEEKLQHTPVEVEEVPATCTTPGTTAGKRCSVCQEIIEGVETIPVDTADSAHQWKLNNTIREATCTEPGYGRYDCKNCGDYKFAEIPASHQWGEPDTVSPTCEEDGSITHSCKVCHETETISIPKTGHNYKDTVTKEATCNEDGIRTYTCQNLGCTDSYTETIPATGEHNYQADILPATCTEPEKAGSFCTVCGTPNGEVTTIGKPLGHSWDEGIVTTPPTCTEDGEKTFTCTRDNCGETRIETAGKLGHDYQPTGSIDATCEESGKSILTCTRCQDETTVDLGELDPPTGHTPSQGICQVCGKILASTTTNAEALEEDNTHKIVFTNRITLDSASIKIVEMGILYRTSETNDPEILTIENVGNNGVRAKKTEEGQITDSTIGFSFKFNVSSQVTRRLSARGYIIIENKDGSRETIYGDVLNGCFNDFPAQP